MSENNQVLVRVSGVDKIYHRGSEDIHVLAGLNLEVKQGEFLALMGPSGSGKSTLLNLIGGLDRPTSGIVEIGGERIDRFRTVNSPTGAPGTSVSSSSSTT